MLVVSESNDDASYFANIFSKYRNVKHEKINSFKELKMRKANYKFIIIFSTTLSIDQIVNLQNDLNTVKFGFIVGKIEEISIQVAKMLTQKKSLSHNKLLIDLIDTSVEANCVYEQNLYILNKSQSTMSELVEINDLGISNLVISAHGTGDLIYINNDSIGKSESSKLPVTKINTNNIFLNSCFGYGGDIHHGLIYSVSSSMILYPGYKDNVSCESFWYLTLIELGYCIGEALLIVNQNLNNRNICAGNYILVGDPTEKMIDFSLKTNTTEIKESGEFNVNISTEVVNRVYLDNKDKEKILFKSKIDFSWIMIDFNTFIFRALNTKNIQNVKISIGIKRDLSIVFNKIIENFLATKIINKNDAGIYKELESSLRMLNNYINKSKYSTKSYFKFDKTYNKISGMRNTIIDNAFLKYLNKFKLTQAPFSEHYSNNYIYDSQNYSGEQCSCGQELLCTNYIHPTGNIFNRKVYSCFNCGVAKDIPANLIQAIEINFYFVSDDNLKVIIHRKGNPKTEIVYACFYTGQKEISIFRSTEKEINLELVLPKVREGNIIKVMCIINGNVTYHAYVLEN